MQQSNNNRNSRRCSDGTAIHDSESKSHLDLGFIAEMMEKLLLALVSIGSHGSPYTSFETLKESTISVRLIPFPQFNAFIYFSSIFLLCSGRFLFFSSLKDNFLTSFSQLQTVCGIDFLLPTSNEHCFHYGSL